MVLHLPQIYFALAGEFDNSSLLAPLVLGVQSMAASRMVFNLRSAASESSTVRMAANSTASEGHTRSGGTIAGKFANLVKTRGVKVTQGRDIDLEGAVATNTVQLPCRSDDFDASEKGIELDDMKAALKADSPRQPL